MTGCAAETLRRACLAIAVLLLAVPGAAADSRDGEVVFQGRASEQGLLYVRDADGTRLRRIRAPSPPLEPAFSPLGRRIAFGSNSAIWVMNADGTDPRRIATGIVPSRGPVWSPSGGALAFAGGSRGRSDIYRIGADGNGLLRLTFGPFADQNPAWSSRNAIAFVRRGRRGDGDLLSIRGWGGRPRRLTSGRHDDGAPAWSPNGRRIAFTRGSPSNRDVYIMRSDGVHLRRLTRLPRGVTSPTWSPDGRRIAFGMGRRGRRAMHVIRTDGRGLRKLTSGAADLRAIDWQRQDPDPLVAAAGDIACDPLHQAFGAGLGTWTQCHQRATSDLLLRMDLSAVLALGDIQYSDGALWKFMQSFHPTWGRVKSLIRPAPGNHEYATDPDANGYFDYFNGAGAMDGPAGRRGLGYYSYDLGEWHMVVLNSMCAQPRSAPTLTDCAAGSPQERWLRADLAANPSHCTLAYWHHPPWSSGLSGPDPAVQPLVQALYDHGVDVLLTGHDHGYERFAPMDAFGNRDGERGVRQFIVGTGGRSHKELVALQPNSEVRDDSSFGVLQLRLRPHGYFWEFLPERAGGFTDSGANACH